MDTIEEKRILTFFRFTVFLKGLNALAEMIGGILILVVNKASIVILMLNLTQNQMSDDPDDLLGTFIVNNIANFSANSQIFFGYYLLSHGIIKIFLVICLLLNKLWAYPLSIVVFSLFIFYEAYRYYFTHSLWLLGLIIFDIIIVWFIWREYKITKTKNVNH